jgi:hypothetical protein
VGSCAPQDVQCVEEFKVTLILFYSTNIEFSDECIKYLGCTFNDEIKFDHDVLEIFAKNF